MQWVHLFRDNGSEKVESEKQTEKAKTKKKCCISVRFWQYILKSKKRGRGNEIYKSLAELFF